MGQFRGGGQLRRESLFIKPIDISLAEQQLRPAQLFLFLFKLLEKAPVMSKQWRFQNNLISHQPLLDKQLSSQFRIQLSTGNHSLFDKRES